MTPSAAIPSLIESPLQKRFDGTGLTAAAGVATAPTQQVVHNSMKTKYFFDTIDLLGHLISLPRRVDVIGCPPIE
jgi:hypothetical protein